MRRGIDAGYISVSTRGNSDFFELHPGRALAGDVPLLRSPAAVYFVHSWSAQRVGRRETVAGRWLERGAFAYVGSVHEPFLQGFNPPRVHFGRMMGLAPWGVAAMRDGAAPWKITVIGDPLITLGPERERADTPLPLEGALDVVEQARRSLAEQEYREAVVGLVLSGQDRAAARLAAALLHEQPGLVTADFAEIALMAVFREGRIETLAELALVLAGAERLDGAAKDAVWHAMLASLNALREPEAKALAASIREDQIVRDTVEAYRAVRASLGRAEAEAVAGRVLAGITDQDLRSELSEALRQER